MVAELVTSRKNTLQFRRNLFQGLRSLSSFDIQGPSMEVSVLSPMLSVKGQRVNTPQRSIRTRSPDSGFYSAWNRVFPAGVLQYSIHDTVMLFS